MPKLTIDQYLDKVAAFVGDAYGRMVRSQFQDIEGCSELGMLASPTSLELDEFRRAVAIMTAAEKAGAADIEDDDVERIARDARADPANLAIFFNGYILYCKRVS